MKRSEAVNKIASILTNLENICSNKIKSEVILDELERLGLSPPEYKTTVKNGWESEYKISLREWEKE